MKIRSGILSFRNRKGLTLVEMAISIGIAATMLMIVTMAVAAGLRLQTEADRLAVAVSLAQTKLSQLMSNPNLTTGVSKGQFGSDGGLYAGYSYEISIKEERIDLAKVAAAGEIKPSVGDQLPAGVQNQVASSVKQAAGTETGGLVDIIRIVVKITYPRGGAGSGEYRVETFKGAPKKV